MILIPFFIVGLGILLMILGIRGTYQNILGWKGPREGKMGG